MTDEEIICTWMEPKPAPGDSSGKWWREENQALCFGELWVVLPTALTLNALWEVEDRLTDEQWGEYEMTIGGAAVRRNGYQYTAIPEDWSCSRFMLHASAEQKIRALAQVLRPLVERDN